MRRQAPRWLARELERDTQTPLCRRLHNSAAKALKSFARKQKGERPETGRSSDVRRASVIDRTSIGGNDLPGDEGCVVAGEERNCPGNVIGPRVARQSSRFDGGLAIDGQKVSVGEIAFAQRVSGETAFTVTKSGPSSRASERVIVMTAPLLAT